MQQRVDGYASIERSSDKPRFSYAISDISAVYKGQLASVKRGAGIKDGKYVVVRDEYTALDKPVTVRWVMLTAADVKITGPNTAELMKDGKTLTLKVVSSAGVQMKTWSTAPTNDFDAPNPGTIMIGFETKVAANGKISQDVLLIPGGQERSVEDIPALQEWK